MYPSLLRKQQRGQGLVEYALILVLVAVVVITVLMVLGPQISVLFHHATGALKCPTEYKAWVDAGQPTEGPAYDAMDVCWTH